MARRPPNMCKEPGCPNPALPGESRCREHYDARKKHKRSIRHQKPKVPYSKDWREISRAYLAAYPFCKVCGRPSEVVHHIIDRAEGGTDDHSNLVALCSSCHSSYHWWKRFNQNKDEQEAMLRAMRK